MTPLSPDAAKRLTRRATEAAVAVAVLLIAGKLYAYLATDSVSVLSTLVDSTLDAFASLINLIAVRHAQTPADQEHRWGHGKAEPLAGLGQAAFIAGSAAFLLIESSHRIADPVQIEQAPLGITIVVGSIIATLALVLFQGYVTRRTGSVAVSADSLHYKGDVLLNGSVIASLVVGQYFDWPYLDPLVGFGIGLYVLWSAAQIGIGSYHMLMDRELPEVDRQRIEDICRAHPDVLGIHDLRTRAAGTDAFIQLHLELEGSMTLLRAHKIADDVEGHLRSAFPNAEVIIHQDPREVVEAARRG